jgi:hypothetical protein
MHGLRRLLKAKSKWGRVSQPMKLGCKAVLWGRSWSRTFAGIALCGVLVIVEALPVAAQTMSRVPPKLPPTAVTVEEGTVDGTNSDASSTSVGATAGMGVQSVAKEAPYTGPIDTAQAKLQLKEDTWAYVHPDKSTTHLEQLYAGSYITVTGTTHYFVRVKLKDGQIGFVPMAAVELARPTDKIFRLTRDTAVLSSPTRFGTKLAEVHNGHDVHVVGVSMSYMKIRMKDGLEGYIASSALE